MFGSAETGTTTITPSNRTAATTGGDSNTTPTPNPNSLISTNTGTTTASATACPPVQSFELDKCEEGVVVVVVVTAAAYNNGPASGGSTTTTDECWEQLPSSKSSSSTLDQQRRHINNNISGGQNGLMERFRRQYFNNHISTRHQADVAIFSVSALQNVNVSLLSAHFLPTFSGIFRGAWVCLQ
ncbi:hypothetical protein GPALN_009729 [Globodera pallida]|nr:hypothetical protein GPALN_009729 [Globodera pallida]